ELGPLLTCALTFVPVERSLRPRVGLFAPLRDKVTSSAQSLVPFRSGQPRRSSLSILTESHDELAPFNSITSSAAIRRTEFMECGKVHSTLVFAALMIGVQRAISLFTNAASGC